MSTAPDPQPSNGTEHLDGEAKRLYWEEFSRKQESKQRTNNFTDEKYDQVVAFLTEVGVGGTQKEKLNQEQRNWLNR